MEEKIEINEDEPVDPNSSEAEIEEINKTLENMSESLPNEKTEKKFYK